MEMCIRDRVSRRELAQHRQLLIVPQQSGYPGGEQISPQVWRLDSFYSMAELLMRKMCIRDRDKPAVISCF